MSKFAKILNLEKGEEKAVFFLLIYSFFIGAALAFYVTSTTSLFLDSFDRDFLPISFIAAGIIVWITGKFMNMLFNKINMSKSIPAGLVFLLLSVLILLVLYKIHFWLVVVFLLYAWIRVFAYMHAVIFWSLAGRLFMLRQAKRVFSVITGGEVFASILAFFSVPVLLKLLNTADLLIISGVFLTFGFLFMLFIVNNFKDKLLSKKSEEKIDKKNELKLFSTKYFKLIFWIAFVPIFAQFFVDFIFQAQAKVEFPDREELTAFIGIFFGVSAIIEFSLKTFISGRLLSKYGVKLGLLAFPVVLGISFLLASVFGFVFGTVGLFFSFVAMGRLFTRAARTSFNDPSTQILYQPIPANQRVLLQNKIESGPKAYASIVAGIILFLFSQIPNMSLVIFSVMLFAVTAFWTKLSVDVFKEYKAKIQEYLTENNLKDDSNIPSIKYLQELFSNGYSFISVNIKKIFFPYNDNKDFKNKSSIKLSEIAKKSNSKNIEDRIFAAQNLFNFSIYRVEKLFIKLLNDDCFEVRNNAIISAGIMKEKDLFDKIIDNFKNITYRKSASNAILYIGAPIVNKLIRTFYSNENNMELQIDIVDIIAKIECNISVNFLRKLIDYPIKPVMDKSITGLSLLNYQVNKTESAIVSEKLEQEINRFVYITASLVDLKKLPEDDFLIIEINNITKRKISHVFDILSVLYSKKAVDLIRNNLQKEDEENRGFAIEIADTVFSELHKEILLPFLEGLSEIELLRRYKQYFPQENLDTYNRIVDLINAEIKTTGIFVKVEAIKKLTDYKSDKTFSVLNSVLVNPIEIISETAAFTLFLLNEDLFEKSTKYLKNTNRKIFNLYNKIKQTSTDNKLLIFEKNQLLSGLNSFKNLSKNELLLLSKNSTEFIINSNEDINMLVQNRKSILIIISGIFEDSNKNIYEAGDVILGLFVNYKTQHFKAKEKSMLFVVPIHVFNLLFSENNDLAENIFTKIISQQQVQ